MWIAFWNGEQSWFLFQIWRNQYKINILSLCYKIRSRNIWKIPILFVFIFRNEKKKFENISINIAKYILIRKIVLSVKYEVNNFKRNLFVSLILKVKTFQWAELIKQKAGKS